MNYIYRITINEDGTIHVPDELKKYKGIFFDMVLHPIKPSATEKNKKIEDIIAHIPRQNISDEEIESIIADSRRKEN